MTATSLPLAEPAQPLPATEWRRWNKIVGTIFFFWSLFGISVVSAVMVTLAFLTMPFDPTGDRVWYLTGLWARANLWVAGVKVDTRAEARLPDGPCIFVCNHQGVFDILALFIGLPRRFVFVAKKSVFRYPFIGWHIGAQGYISVDRSNRERSIASMEVAGQRIRGGISVAVFPEGTRSWDGSILPFKKGPFMVALKAGVPIVPVALEGSLHVCPKRTWYVCPNTVRILLGPPIPTAGLTDADRDDLIKRVRKEVIRMHRRLGGLGGDERNPIAAAGVEGIGRAADEGAQG
jgi:1-acyl-sn-glycerol-3-phosphate acyltransferase